MGDTLRVGEQLAPGQALRAGPYTLTLQNDGNLVLAEPDRTVWESYTPDIGVNRAVLQEDGNFVLYTERRATFNTETCGKPADRLVLRADRNVVLYAKDDTVLWESRTTADKPYYPTVLESLGDTLRPGQELRPGQSLQSDGGAYALTLQKDGNLVLLESAGTVWESYTRDIGVNRAVLQEDGNFVLYTERQATFNTETCGKPADRLVLRADRNVVLYAKDDTVLWESRTTAPDLITA
ncbi:hypothetical protein [Streptomyces sp. NPDC051657]|uniref:hypothetical protein n=1 Tax=unclassified Streptomyces TaxID=2593676 RepID=UPI00342AC95E